MEEVQQKVQQMQQQEAMTYRETRDKHQFHLARVVRSAQDKQVHQQELLAHC